MTDNGDTVTVRSLLCHSHVEMGITCYKELLKHCRDRIKLCIHDDGSLTEDDVDRLRNAGAEIVRRRDVDAVMEEYLKDYPAYLLTPCSDERWARWLNTADAALRERVATLC